MRPPTRTVTIHGEMPFDIYQHGEVTLWLALLNCPTSKLRIKYDDTPVTKAHKPFYPFHVVGTAEVWEATLKDLVKMLVDAGAKVDKIETALVEDTVAV